MLKNSTSNTKFTMSDRQSKVDQACKEAGSSDH